MNALCNRQKLGKEERQKQCCPLFRIIRANHSRHRIAATLDSANSERIRSGRSRSAGALGPRGNETMMIFSTRLNNEDNRKATVHGETDRDV
jgi:hypothetical protein